jgi:hypothetical protein
VWNRSVWKEEWIDGFSCFDDCSSFIELVRLGCPITEKVWKNILLFGTDEDFDVMRDSPAFSLKEEMLEIASTKYMYEHLVAMKAQQM